MHDNPPPSTCQKKEPTKQKTKQKRSKWQPLHPRLGSSPYLPLHLAPGWMTRLLALAPLDSAKANKLFVFLLSLFIYCLPGTAAVGRAWPLCALKLINSMAVFDKWRMAWSVISTCDWVWMGRLLSSCRLKMFEQFQWEIRATWLPSDVLQRLWKEAWLSRQLVGQDPRLDSWHSLVLGQSRACSQVTTTTQKSGDK